MVPNIGSPVQNVPPRDFCIRETFSEDRNSLNDLLKGFATSTKIYNFPHVFYHFHLHFKNRLNDKSRDRTRETS